MQQNNVTVIIKIIIVACLCTVLQSPPRCSYVGHQTLPIFREHFKKLLPERLSVTSLLICACNRNISRSSLNISYVGTVPTVSTFTVILSGGCRSRPSFTAVDSRRAAVTGWAGEVVPLLYNTLAYTKRIFSNYKISIKKYNLIVLDL